MLTSIPNCGFVSVACLAHGGNLSRHLQRAPPCRGGNRTARLSSSLQTQRDHYSRLSCVVNATESSQTSERSPQEVEAELRDAVRLEQYGRAAELRDLLKTLQPQNTAAALKKKLDKLVADEQYEVSNAKLLHARIAQCAATISYVLGRMFTELLHACMYASLCAAQHAAVVP